MTSRAKRHKVTTPAGIGDLPGYDFTLQEKKNLLQALKNNGFNLTYRMDLLGESLPGRTSHEIANLIHTYRQRGKRQISQQESPSPAPRATPPPPTSTAASASSTAAATTSSSEPNSSSSSNSKRPICPKNSPISQWSQLLGHIIHPRNKRDDLSETLISVLQGYSNNNNNNNSSNNGNSNNNDNNNESDDDDRRYSSIYEFVSDCLQGKCPRELNPQNSLIILSLLKQAKNLLQYVGCDVERKFLQNSKKYSFQESKEAGQLTCTSEQSQLQESETLCSQFTATVTTAPTTSSSSSSSSSTSSSSSSKAIECHLSDPVTQGTLRGRLGHFVESCMDLPKVKKIKSCLNPLNVPVSMTVEESNCLLEAIEDLS